MTSAVEIAAALEDTQRELLRTRELLAASQARAEVLNQDLAAERQASAAETSRADGHRDAWETTLYRAQRAEARVRALTAPACRPCKHWHDDSGCRLGLHVPGMTGCSEFSEAQSTDGREG